MGGGGHAALPHSLGLVGRSPGIVRVGACALRSPPPPHSSSCAPLRTARRSSSRLRRMAVSQNPVPLINIIIGQNGGIVFEVYDPWPCRRKTKTSKKQVKRLIPHAPSTQVVVSQPKAGRNVSMPRPPAAAGTPAAPEPGSAEFPDSFLEAFSPTSEPHGSVSFSRTKGPMSPMSPMSSPESLPSSVAFPPSSAKSASRPPPRAARSGLARSPPKQTHEPGWPRG